MLVGLYLIWLFIRNNNNSRYSGMNTLVIVFIGLTIIPLVIIGLKSVPWLFVITISIAFVCISRFFGKGSGRSGGGCSGGGGCGG